MSTAPACGTCLCTHSSSLSIIALHTVASFGSVCCRIDSESRGWNALVTANHAGSNVNVGDDGVLAMSNICKDSQQVVIRMMVLYC